MRHKCDIDEGNWFTSTTDDADDHARTHICIYASYVSLNFKLNPNNIIHIMILLAHYNLSNCVGNNVE